MPDQRLRPTERIRRRPDYARTFAAKRSAADPALVVYVHDNGLPWSRLGLSVARRVGNAVRRAYIRRRIREAFRRVKHDLPAGLDIICIARNGAADRHVDLQRSLRKLVPKARKRPARLVAGNHRGEAEPQRRPD